MKSIRQLPKSVHSTLRSGVILFDLTRVVEELIFNSIDAGSTKVNVTIRVDSCYIKAEDNGYGITRDGLVLLGQRHATSKPNCLAEMEAAPENFGFRGEALASLSDISLLEITSKARGTPNGYRKIIKGCKCLYLGLDDNRQDLGTTVIVRDLFYNQPVRRKYMLSSPKKVLHSVKKCVLRIALAHPLVSFKVVDTESGAEVLFTHPSPSPMPLVTSAFGIDVSRSLHELSFSKGSLMLSGYLSDPVGILSMKAFQYVYINSRFVSKGPIHKLLNNLASSSKSLDLLKDSSGFQNGKRNRVQAHPAYLLNLRCPRSIYDLTFEPYKTIIEFKDWDSLLSFIEQSIRNFWRQSPIEGDSHTHKDEIPGKHETWKEDDDMLSTDISLESEITKKKRRIQRDQAFMRLSPSSCSQKIAYEEAKPFSHGKSCRKPSGKMSVNAEVVKAQNRTGYLRETDYTTQDMVPTSCCPSSFKCVSTASRPECGLHLWSPGCSPFLMEDNFLQPAEGYVNADSFGEGWENLFPEADNMDVGSSGILPSCDIFDNGNEVLSPSGFHVSPNKPLLQNCSLLGNMSPVGAVFASRKGTDNQSDEYWTNGKRSGDMINILDGTNSCQHFDFSLETPFHNNFSNFIPFSSIQKKHHAERDTDEDVLLSKYARPHSSDRVNFPEENDLDSLVQIEEIVANPLSMYSEFYSMFPFSTGHVKDECSKAEYAPKGNNVSCTTDGSCYFRTRKGVDEFVGYENMCDSSIAEECSVSSCTDIEFYYEYSVTPKRFFHRAQSQSNNTCVQKVGLSNKLAGGTDWSFSDLSIENGIHGHENQAFQKPPSCCHKYFNPREKLDSQNGRENHISQRRSRRSHSAPPFYQGKRKFSTISNCLPTAVEAKSNAPDLLVTNNFQHSSRAFGLSQYEFEPTAGNGLKTSDFKNSSQVIGPSPRCLEPSAGNYSLFYSGTYVEKMPNSAKMVNGSQNSENFDKLRDSLRCQIYNFNPAEDELEDSKFSGVKWRDGNFHETDGDKSNNFHEQNDILDISSGLLHLAGASVIPDSISIDCLHDAKVLLQLDKKFIPIVAGRILAVIDQHAADERIRLEELRVKVLSGEGKTVAHLDAEQELVLPESEYQLLQNYAEQITNWGWICNFHSQQSGSFTKNINLLHRQSSVVSLVAVPCILGVNLSEKDLLEFLEQLAETDGSSTVPPSVLRVLNFKACRGAIMFGDALLPSECSLLIDELKLTSLCFQCAHGRPTTVPLVNLEALHKQIANLGCWNASSDETWHGLRRRTLSLERARQRLISARS